MTFARSGLSWACAVLLAVAAPTVHSAMAVANAATAKLLSSQLPAGLTLAKASIDQTAAAVKSATAQRPDEAASLVQLAIVAKTPKQGHGTLACSDVLKIARAAIASAPNQAKEVVNVAKSLVPACADALDELLPTATGTGAGAEGLDDAGFGVGFGTGFPGSPGFTGSSPGGAVALPPAPPAVTSVLNT